MVEENISQEFRLKNIDKTKNYFPKETEKNQLISKIHKKICITLNYIENFLLLASRIIGCISVSAFVSLFGVLIGITSYA